MIMAVEASIVSRPRERAMDTSECVGCKLVMPAHPGPTHRYIRCSPECWSLFGEVLAREFQNQRLFRAVHQVTVDTYAVQHAVDHPAKSLTCHLVSLFAILGRSQMQDEDADTLVRFVQGRAKFPRLEAPADMGPMTIFDVAIAGESDHEVVVRRWARHVWDAWAPEHHTSASVAREALR